MASTDISNTEDRKGLVKIDGDDDIVNGEEKVKRFEVVKDPVCLKGKYKIIKLKGECEEFACIETVLSRYFADKYETAEIMKKSGLFPVSDIDDTLDTMSRLVISTKDIEEMKHLILAGMPMSVCLTSDAAENGDLETLKWLVEIGCPVGSEAYTRALYNGDIKSAAYLREAGCPTYGGFEHSWEPIIDEWASSEADLCTVIKLLVRKMQEEEI